MILAAVLIIALIAGSVSVMVAKETGRDVNNILGGGLGSQVTPPPPPTSPSLPGGTVTPPPGSGGPLYIQSVTFYHNIPYDNTIPSENAFFGRDDLLFYGDAQSYGPYADVVVCNNTGSDASVTITLSSTRVTGSGSGNVANGTCTSVQVPVSTTSVGTDTVTFTVSGNGYSSTYSAAVEVMYYYECSSNTECLNEADLFPVGTYHKVMRASGSFDITQGGLTYYLSRGNPDVDITAPKVTVRVINSPATLDGGDTVIVEDSQGVYLTNVLTTEVYRSDGLVGGDVVRCEDSVLDISTLNLTAQRCTISGRIDGSMRVTDSTLDSVSASLDAHSSVNGSSITNSTIYVEDSLLSVESSSIDSSDIHILGNGTLTIVGGNINNSSLKKEYSADLTINGSTLNSTSFEPFASSSLGGSVTVINSQIGDILLKRVELTTSSSYFSDATVQYVISPTLGGTSLTIDNSSGTIDAFTIGTSTGFSDILPVYISNSTLLINNPNNVEIRRLSNSYIKVFSPFREGYTMQIDNTTGSSTICYPSGNPFQPVPSYAKITLSCIPPASNVTIGTDYDPNTVNVQGCNVIEVQSC